MNWIKADIDRSGDMAVTEEEAELLRAIAINLRPTCIVEVGTGRGASLRAFCDAAEYLRDKGQGCEVWSCDVVSSACATGALLCPDAHVICGNSRRLVLALPSTSHPELVFIDGGHHEAEVFGDYTRLSKIAAPGAAFLFHDARPMPGHGDGVLKTLQRIGATILPTSHGLAIYVETTEG